MEGYLPLPWAVFWTILALPFIIYGIRAMAKLFAEHPERKLSLALSGAFIVILSSLKIPSAVGSSSHPTGTGMCVMLSGPAVTTVICTIVLIFQGMFMAHGGFTTLGANVFSMGVAGPFVAYAVFRFLNKRKVNSSATVFTTAFVANVATYSITALQLALIVPFEGLGALVGSFINFFGIFAITQIPIAAIEGVLMVFFFRYLADVRPDIVEHIGYKASSRNTGGLLDGKPKKKKGRLALVCSILVLAAMILVAYLALFFSDLPGTDDLGAGAIEILVPGFEKWTEDIIQIGEFGINLLFILQTAIGILILAVVLYLLLGRHEHKSEFETVDTVAYRSPMLKWSPLVKLAMVVALLILNIASPSIWISVFIGCVGFVLFLYASSFRPPSIMMRLFVFAEVFIVISAVIFAIIIPGDPAVSLRILTFTINFTDSGISFAVLMVVRATAALLVMFAFAVSTPVPHLSAALRRIRLPNVFVEMMVLIYRYTFLLMESSEKMHLAAECRFGYSTYGKSMRTTARLTVGVFTRSLEVAERGQTTLQCRNYKGEFRSLSNADTRSGWGTVVCSAVVIIALILFAAAYKGVL